MTDAFPGPDPYDPDISDEDFEDSYYDYDDNLPCGCCSCCGCMCDLYEDDLYDYADLPLDDELDD